MDKEWMKLRHQGGIDGLTGWIYVCVHRWKHKIRMADGWKDMCGMNKGRLGEFGGLDGRIGAGWVD